MRLDKIVKERREVVGVIAIVDREEGINEEQLRDRNIELLDKLKIYGISYSPHK